MTIEEVAAKAHAANVKRGVVRSNTSRAEFVRAIRRELEEYADADSYKADKHLPQWSEPEVELADVIIAALGAFTTLGYNFQAIEDKLNYNGERED